MANTNESIPNPSPATATGGAKPISNSDLQREIGLPPMQIRTPEGDPPPSPEGSVKGKQTFREENAANITMGDDKGNRETEKTLPGFSKAAQELLEKKARGEVTESEPKKKERSEKTKEKATLEEPIVDKSKSTEVTKSPEITEEVPEEHRRVLPHDKPDTAKRIKYFLAEKARLESESAAAKKELEELRAKAPAAIDEKEAERQKAERDELIRYRRRYDLEKDEEFKTKYREPIQKVEDAIESTLKKYKFNDDTLAAIKAEGGFASFTNSNRTFPVQVPDEDEPGETKTVYQTAAQLARNWIAGMNVADAEELKASLGKQQLLRSEERAATQKALEEANQYFEKASIGQKQQAEQQAEMTRKSTEAYNSYLKDVESKNDWLRIDDIPDDATPEQKQKIESKNAFAKEIRESFSKHPTNTKEYAEMKFAAAEAKYLRHIQAEKDARIEELESQLKKSKASMRTTPKSGSILHGNTGASPSKPQELADPTDFKTAIRRAAQKMVNGED